MFGQTKSKIKVDRATNEDFAKALPVEMTCRTGFNNIKGDRNESGKKDYIHVKTEKSYVKYLVTGCTWNEKGDLITISARPVKPTAGTEVDEEDEELAMWNRRLESVEQAIDSNEVDGEALEVLEERKKEIEEVIESIEQRA